MPSYYSQTFKAAFVPVRYTSKTVLIMSHNINFNEQTGTHSFFSVKEKAWHGLGKIVQDYPTSAEAIKQASLDYVVEKRPLFTYDNHNASPAMDNSLQIAGVQVPNYFATVRTDTEQVLGVVGKDYEVIQNKYAFTFFDAIVGRDGIMYETAGALGKGERIFITAKLPGYITGGKDDLIEKYLFLTTSHDGFGSITAAFTPIRIVCNNTLNAALRNCSNSIKIRHTQSAKERLEQAHKVMGIANRLSEDLEAIFNRWSKVIITDKSLKKLIQLAMVPNKEVWKNIQQGKQDKLSTAFKNMCDNVYEYALSSPTQNTATTKETVFGAYNAVTGYFQNVRMYKNEDAKVKSLLLGGTGQLRSQTAFDICEAYSQKGEQAFQLN
jgi:phage/plasmid-like protein (TIGR03299 family)